MKRKIILAVMLIFTLTFTIPIGTLIVQAAPLEDCDLDGFDDSTGVPVPWPGYDETKGDTSAGPGGSTTTTPTTSSTSTITDYNTSTSSTNDTNATNTASNITSSNVGVTTNKTTTNIENTTGEELETQVVDTTNEKVALNQDEEVAKQQIEASPKAVNKGLVPGLIILSVLVLAGGSALLINKIIKKKA